MTIVKTNIGTNEDGTPRWHYHSDGAVVITGPITGEVTTGDGTVYNVTDEVVEVDLGHVDEVAALVGERYTDEGHPAHDQEHPFAVSEEK